MKDTTDTVKSASYFDFHLIINKDGRQITNFYDKHDHARMVKLK